MNLQAKYQLSISIILTLSIVLLALLLLWYGKQASVEVRTASADLMRHEMMVQVEERALSLVRALSSNLVNPLYSYRIESIYRLLANALKNNDVVAVEVFDPHGVIQHDGTRDITRFGAKVSNGRMVAALNHGASYHSTLENGRLSLAHAIKIGDKLLGGVCLTLSLERVSQNIALMNRELKEISQTSRNRQVVIALAASLLSLAAALVLGMMLARYLVYPIRQLVQATHSISEGQYHFTLDLKRRDELGELADSFNAMSRSLDRHQQEVHHIAYHDALTELPNRLMMKKLLNESLETSRKEESLMALMLIDLDNFKEVNDSLGHDAGDLLLKEAARRIADEVRNQQDLVMRGELPHDRVEQQMVSRLGGDEFTVIAVDLSVQKDAAAIARRIIQALRRPFVIQEQVVGIGASIGITLAPLDGESAEVLIKNADLAMYQAKYKGKNTFAFYDQEMTREIEKFSRVKQELGAAFEHAEFELYLQPQVRLDTGRVVGSEALIRWNHPERGLVLPGEFVQVAEETGLIAQMDDWVLESACSMVRYLEQRLNSSFYLAVNLSSQQLTDKRLPRKLQRLLGNYKISSGSLHLEVTETMLIKDEGRAALVLDQVAAIGCPIWLDDFGTGFSSISHLQRFPLTGIKIDRAFIKNLHERERDRQLAHALITLAKMLNLEVTAEGVEREEQALYLKQWECPLAQGYLYSRPLPLDEFKALLQGLQGLQGQPQSEAGRLSAAEAETSAEILPV